MSAPQPEAYHLFYKLALEYYVNGRAASRCGCVLTTGNLLHHAVEMLLKGELSRTISLDVLRNREKFGHSLSKCWLEFKTLFPTEELNDFDPLIVELDKFERIRYPNHILLHGAGIGIGSGHSQATTGEAVNQIPEYRIPLGDIDAFFACMTRLSCINPWLYLTVLTADGLDILRKNNDQSKDWLP